MHTAELAGLLARTGLDVRAAAERPAAIVLDATAVTDIPTLAEVHAALHPVARSVASSGRIVVLGAPLSRDDHHQAAAQQALEGFVRSLGKETGAAAPSPSYGSKGPWQPPSRRCVSSCRPSPRTSAAR